MLGRFTKSSMFSGTFRKIILNTGRNIKVHKCNIVDDIKNTNQCYVLMRPLREHDTFTDSFDNKKMVELFFPETTSEMAQSLSNVTSAFYGIMLESTGKIIGMENIDKVSKDFFYNLGKVKTRLTNDAIAGKYEIPKDARGVVILLVSAIYNASPEYKINVREFTENSCEIDLTGSDRYYRITKALGMNNHLEWPVLHRFMEGINDEMQANTEIKSEMLDVKDNGECHERFTIQRRR